MRKIASEHELASPEYRFQDKAEPVRTMPERHLSPVLAREIGKQVMVGRAYRDGYAIAVEGLLTVVQR
jgi:hypothetical protein